LNPRGSIRIIQNVIMNKKTAWTYQIGVQRLFISEINLLAFGLIYDAQTNYKIIKTNNKIIK